MNHPVYGHIYRQGDTLLLYRGTVSPGAVPPQGSEAEDQAFLKIAAKGPRPQKPVGDGTWYRYITKKAARGLPEVSTEELACYVAWEWKDKIFDKLLKGGTP